MKNAISASDLARNTSAILERVLTGESVSVMRNRTEIAYIVPAKRMMSASQAIVGLEGKLTPSEGKAWLKESRARFNEKMTDPWE